MEINGIYSTRELKKHIIGVYQCLETLAKQDDVYKNMDTKFEFANTGYGDGQYCFSDAAGYYFRCLERGYILTDKKTSNLFEITYWVMAPWISEMSYAYEKKHRIKHQDIRRLMFQKELQYFAELGEEYRKRAESDIIEILKNHPYQDGLFR